MKLYDIVVYAFKEIKIGYKLLCLAFVATSVMIAVSIILFNISESSMEVLYSHYSDFMKDGIDANIANAEFKDIEKIEYMGLSDINVVCTSEKIYNSVLKDENGKVIDNTPEPVYINSKDIEQIKSLGKFDISDNFNNENYAYILAGKEDYQRLRNIKTITVYDKKENEKCKFTVKKVILSNEEITNIYVPFQKLYEAYKSDGVYLSVKIGFTVKDISEYSVMKQKLESNGFAVSSSIDNLENITSMLNMFFKAMAITVIVLGILSLIIICNMYFNSRNKHIILQKTLGMTSKEVFAILFVIIETVLIASTITAMIIVFFGNKYIHSVLFEVFGNFNYSEYNTFYASLVSFIAANISAVIASLGIYQKVKCTDIVSMLGNNE